MMGVGLIVSGETEEIGPGHGGLVICDEEAGGHGVAEDVASSIELDFDVSRCSKVGVDTWHRGECGVGSVDVVSTVDVQITSIEIGEEGQWLSSGWFSWCESIVCEYLKLIHEEWDRWEQVGVAVLKEER